MQLGTSAQYRLNPWACKKFRPFRGMSSHCCTISEKKQFSCKIFMIYELLLVSWITDTCTLRGSMNPNSMPQGCGCDLRCVYFKHNMETVVLMIQVNTILEWIPEDSVDSKTTLAHIITWCHQQTSQYLNQYWSRSLTPFGATMGQYFMPKGYFRTIKQFCQYNWIGWCCKS